MLFNLELVDEDQTCPKKKQRCANNGHGGIESIGVIHSAPCVGGCHEVLDRQAQGTGDNGGRAAGLTAFLARSFCVIDPAPDGRNAEQQEDDQGKYRDVDDSIHRH